MVSSRFFRCFFCFISTSPRFSIFLCLFISDFFIVHRFHCLLSFLWFFFHFQALVSQSFLLFLSWFLFVSAALYFLIPYYFFGSEAIFSSNLISSSHFFSGSLCCSSNFSLSFRVFLDSLPFSVVFWLKTHL